MIKTTTKLIFIIAVIFLFIGCSTRNYEYYEGLGDYRYSNPKYINDTNSSFEMKYLRENNISGTTFKKHDNIAIYLKNVKLNYISEGIKERLVDTVTKHQSNDKIIGEIAIIADIKPGIVGMQGRYNSSSIGGKLIYYSGDFHQGQSANQSFSPVYGPIEWDGKGLSVSITILEIDKDNNEQFEGLLKTISHASSVFTNIGSSASKLLETIGQQLINSNKDDILGQYVLHLLPQGSDSNVSEPILHTGDLVLVRQSDRRKNIKWNTLKYDHTKGLLSDDKGLNYLVFTFSKPSEVYNNNLMNYDEFMQSFSSKNNNFEKNIDVLSATLKENKQFQLYKKQLLSINNGHYIYSKELVLNDILLFLQCSIVHNNKSGTKKNECKHQGIYFSNDKIYYLLDKLNIGTNIKKIETIGDLVDQNSTLEDKRKIILQEGNDR